MDRRSPGGRVLSHSMDHEFSADEIEVAATLTCLKFLILLYHSCHCGFITPLWGSKRPRSASSSAVTPSSTGPRPDRPRTESRVLMKGTALSCEGNRRNVSPDSPLLLMASPESLVIVGEPTEDKKATKDDVDDSALIKKPKKKLKKEKMERRIVEENKGTESEELPVQVDVNFALRGQPHCQLSDSQPTRASSAICHLPDGGARTSPGSPLQESRPLFDLNIAPPDYADVQSPQPDESNWKPGLPPSNGVASHYGSIKAEEAKANRQKRIAIRRGNKARLALRR